MQREKVDKVINLNKNMFLKTKMHLFLSFHKQFATICEHPTSIFNYIIFLGTQSRPKLSTFQVKIWLQFFNLTYKSLPTLDQRNTNGSNPKCFNLKGAHFALDYGVPKGPYFYQRNIPHCLIEYSISQGKISIA